MTLRLRSSLLLAALCLSVAHAQQQQQQRPNTPPRQLELTVKIADERDRPISFSVRIQVLNSMGVPVMETFSRDGEARFPGISPGTYRLRATALEIEDSNSEQSFSMSNWDTVHFEYLRVKRKPVPGEEAQSTDGYVSMATLNIPEKALKEFNKGRDALEKQDFGEAQKRFEKAATIYPKYAVALNNLGFLAMRNNDTAGGESYFEKAIAADEQYPAAYMNLAKLRWSQKRFPEAEKLLVKNSTLDPKNVEALALLTNLNAMAGRYDEAITIARKVHTMPHQEFAVAHYIAGMAFQAKNQFGDAAVEYRQYLKEAPQGKSSDNARNALSIVEQKLTNK